MDPYADSTKDRHAVDSLSGSFRCCCCSENVRGWVY